MKERKKSEPLVASTIQKIGDPFRPIPVIPRNHKHLRGIRFTENYPILKRRPFDVLVSEPYYSQLMLAEQSVSPDPAVASAKCTKLR